MSIWNMILIFLGATSVGAVVLVGYLGRPKQSFPSQTNAKTLNDQMRDTLDEQLLGRLAGGESLSDSKRHEVSDWLLNILGQRRDLMTRKTWLEMAISWSVWMTPDQAKQLSTLLSEDAPPYALQLIDATKVGAPKHVVETLEVARDSILKRDAFAGSLSVATHAQHEGALSQARESAALSLTVDSFEETSKK